MRLSIDDLIQKLSVERFHDYYQTSEGVLLSKQEADQVIEELKSRKAMKCMNGCISNPCLLTSDRAVNFRDEVMVLHLEFYECMICGETYMNTDQMQTALDMARLKWESAHAPS
jgi:hypothetical protein